MPCCMLMGCWWVAAGQDKKKKKKKKKHKREKEDGDENAQKSIDGSGDAGKGGADDSDDDDGADSDSKEEELAAEAASTAVPASEEEESVDLLANAGKGQKRGKIHVQHALDCKRARTGLQTSAYMYADAGRHAMSNRLCSHVAALRAGLGLIGKIQGFSIPKVKKAKIGIDSGEWYYLDRNTVQQGPFEFVQIKQWHAGAFFDDKTSVKNGKDGAFYPLSAVMACGGDLPALPDTAAHTAAAATAGTKAAGTKPESLPAVDASLAGASASSPMPTGPPGEVGPLGDSMADELPEDIFEVLPGGQPKCAIKEMTCR